MASRFLTEADKNELAKRIPTKTSELSNDSGYVTDDTIPTKTSQLTNDSGFLTQHQDLNNYALKENIPTKTSQLTNDSGFLTQHQDLSNYALKENIPTKTSQLTNDSFGGTVEITSGNPEKENTVLTLDPSSESVNVYTAEETDAKLEQMSREFNERLNSIQNGNGVAY